MYHIIKTLKNKRERERDREKKNCQSHNKDEGVKAILYPKTKKARVWSICTRQITFFQTYIAGSVVSSNINHFNINTTDLKNILSPPISYGHEHFLKAISSYL